MSIHNFSAGPSILPKEVFEEAAAAVLDFNGSGLSLLEMSHRSAPFEAVMDEAMVLVKSLLDLDTTQKVMFLSGGASSQFFMIPMNLLNPSGRACYVNTGTWASGAIKEAKAFGNVEVLGSSENEAFTHIPKDFMIPSDATYLHLTSNNTIYGTQYHSFPDSPIPIVCDMSSDIFSKPINAQEFGVIYAGAQKNMGPAGTTLVIVKEELLGHVDRHIPTMLDYRTHIKSGSMYNTPPVFPIYVSMLTMRWIKKMGGPAAMKIRNQGKAELLYNEIDRNPLFKGTVAKDDRSWMNANFVLQNEALGAAFDAAWKAAEISGLKGHRSVGGYRASMYNALPLESVQVLVDVMKDFEKSNG
ncbi:MAG: 3-phosphoserine/phosphohydroxythreonine transaminase [Saprospiraceae bacterium]